MPVKASKIVGWNPEALKKQLTKNAVAYNNKNLVEYAKGHIMLLGETINAWSSKSNMDDTGNLLDSLCWCVCYDGELVDKGFYRDKKSNRPSYLHGWSTVEFIEGKSSSKKWNGLYGASKSMLEDSYIKMDAGEAVNGHELAAAYLEKAPKRCKKGQWMVMFAILAPYWGYWEKGFNMTHGFGGGGMGTFMQFAVMSQFYDQVSVALKPARTRFSVSVPHYASKSLYAQAKKNL